MSRGWYRMHRGWMASPDFQAEPFTDREAFLWSIEQAAFEPHLMWFNRVQFEVARGEFVTSIRTMAAAFQWGDKRTRLFIARMVKRQKWAQRGTHLGAHGPTILTVCNYERFQTAGDDEGTVGGTAKGAARAQSGHSQGTQQKKGKNGQEGKEANQASPVRVTPCPFDEMVAAWSQAAAIAGWTPLNPGLSDKRKRGLAAIFKAHGLQGWIAGIQRALDSPVLGGPDPPGWFNFEFVTNPNNFLKLIEGNYDKQFGNRSEQQQSGWLDARQQLSGDVHCAGTPFARTRPGRGNLVADHGAIPR